MNWNDPAERAALIERVGGQEYNRLFQEHVEQSTVAFVNGYRIRPVGSRFGLIFMVEGSSGFRTQAEAEAHAATLPSKKPEGH